MARGYADAAEHLGGVHVRRSGSTAGGCRARSAPTPLLLLLPAAATAQGVPGGGAREGRQAGPDVVEVREAVVLMVLLLALVVVVVPLAAAAVRLRKRAGDVLPLQELVHNAPEAVHQEGIFEFLKVFWRHPLSLDAGAAGAPTANPAASPAAASTESAATAPTDRGRPVPIRVHAAQLP